MASAEDVVVRILAGSRLTTPARRLLARSPAWLKRLSTREIRNRIRLVDGERLEERLVEVRSRLRFKGVGIEDYSRQAAGKSTAVDDDD